MVAQLRFKKREKAVTLPKLSINIFDVSKGAGGAGGSRKKRKYVRLP